MTATFLLLTLGLIHPHTGDLLDSVKSKAQIVRNLKDLYRTYSVDHTIDREKDDINASVEFSGGTGLKDVLSANIDECQRLQDVELANPGVRKQVTEYLAATIRDYRILMNDGSQSVEFKNDYAQYRKLRTSYLEYVLKRFSLGSFIKLTEAEYHHNIDKRNYVNSARFEEYESVKRTDLRQAMRLLEALRDSTRDFQEWSVYQIALADDYVMHPDRFDTDTTSAFETAARLYRSILDKKEYGLYLFEAWAKWRSVYQKTLGELKTSNIPNDKYEIVREQVAEVILEHIAQHPKDEMAINEFIVLATRDILLRFGEYPEGNQNAVEFKNLFGGSP